MKLLVLAALLFAAPIAAQTAQDVHEAERTAQGLGALRPGAGGNPGDPNPANADEARVGSYTAPPLFTAPAQQTAAGWPARRTELARLVEDNWVGRIPESVAGFRVLWTKRVVDAGREHWIGQVIAADGRMGPCVDAIISFPAGARAAPALIDYSYIWPGGRAPAFTAPGEPLPPDPVQFALARGWVHVAYRPQLLQADTAATMREGVIGLARWPRAATDWGALRAWAWGASQLRTELALDPRINGARISLAGHSRFGKGVLVAAAFDHAFADALVSSAGAGGSKLMRRDFGERWENMAGSGAFHWFTPAIMRFAEGTRTTHDLPIDAHTLIALRAPRPLFISSGLAERGDAWVDPAGMWTAFALAQPAWDVFGASTPQGGAMPVAQSLEQARFPLGWYQHGEGHVPWPAWGAFYDHAERFAD